MQLLMDSSLILIFLTVFLSLLLLQIRKTLKREQLSVLQYVRFLEIELSREVGSILVWMVVTLIWSFIASFLVFRCFWSPDAFLVAFMTRMRLHKVLKAFKDLI